MRLANVLFLAALILAAAVPATATDTPIGMVKAAGSGWSGSIKGIVTAVYQDYGTFVVEQEDRSAAITVAPMPTNTPQTGDEVEVTGSLGSTGMFAAKTVLYTGRHNVDIRSMGVNNRDITGAAGNPGLGNMDMLIRTWGKVVSGPTYYPDYSVSYDIDDGSNPRGASSSVVFADNFDSGKDPRWADYAGTTTVQFGQLVAGSSQNIAVVTSPAEQDVTVSVDATAGVQMGILLRYQDNNNFVLAFFSPTASPGPILGFHERIGGVWGPWRNYVSAPGLTGVAHLVASVSGSTVSATLSDTTRTYSTSYTLTTLLGPGLIGLYHDESVGPDPVYFDNFRASASTPTSPDDVRVMVPPTLHGLVKVQQGDYVAVSGIAGKTTLNNTPMRAVTLAPSLAEARRFPPVVVSWNGTGDFGPNTPGTQTSGLQEAINYCITNHRDLYIQGGWKGVVYNLNATVHIPATSDFRIDSGICVLNWTFALGTPQDGLVIDSGLNCRYTFGIMVYGGATAIIRVRPSSAIPGDGRVGFFDSEIRASSIADPHPFSPGPRVGIGGIVFDTSYGPIAHNDFYFTAILNFGVNVTTTGSGGDFANNSFTCVNLHTNATDSILFDVGANSHDNAIETQISVDQGATGVRGFDVYGYNNRISVSVGGGFQAGYQIILEASAERNRINLNQTGNPLSLITDAASEPTNRLFWTGNQVGLSALPVTAGNYTYLQRLYPSTVWITGGSVQSIQRIRNGVATSLSLPPVSVMLAVDDKLQITSTSAPSAQVIPGKVR